ncbi:hypothetical protein ACHAXT_011453 [Thalassiosira profunda]
MGAGQSKQPPAAPPAAAVVAASDLAAATNATTNANAAESSTPANASSAGESGGGGCPMKNPDGSYRVMPGFASLFGKMGDHPPVDKEKVQLSSAATASNDQGTAESSGGSNGGGNESGSGCPVKHSGSSRGWNLLRRSGPGPGSDGLSQSTQQYDVYSRPLPMDPTNNMPVSNPAAAARNSLPAPGQNEALPTERVKSSIPKGSSDGKASGTWTYPSPQMFYNALARKGKLDEETKEEDMMSVVAIHNCMNEGTWEKIKEWEGVLNPASEGFDGSYGKKEGEGGNESESGAAGPSLTKFMGRPTDLSPKAFFKHYILNHPLPFDRHDWTVARTHADGSTKDVRYVIDYYHDEAAANEEEGSGLPGMHEGIGDKGRIKSLLVDVRPAADGPSEIWGRMVTMPLARRGCRSMLECVLFKGQGSGKKSDFDPLPLAPSESLKQSLGDSKVVWDNIQKDAAAKKGVGAKDEACASDALEGGREVADVASAAESGRQTMQSAPGIEEDVQMTKVEAKDLAGTYAQILTSCEESKLALKNCASDEECRRAFMGMTVCAGQYMCPLQHSAFMDSLEPRENETEEMAQAKMSTAFEVLGECVANYDARAAGARRQYWEAFEDALKGKGR